jgi:hypothetical protein
MCLRSTMSALSNWLGDVLFGNRVAQDQDPNSQFDTILVAYVLNALLIGALIAAGLAIVGAFDTTRAPLSSKFGPVIAASNALSLMLTYFYSLSWTPNNEMIDRLGKLAAARGRYYSLFVRFAVPIALLGITAASFIFIVGLYTLKFSLLAGLSVGNLFASIAVNVVLLQALFVRRSVRANYDPSSPSRSASNCYSQSARNANADRVPANVTIPTDENLDRRGRADTTHGNPEQ